MYDTISNIFNVYIYYIHIISVFIVFIVFLCGRFPPQDSGNVNRESGRILSE